MAEQSATPDPKAASSRGQIAPDERRSVPVEGCICGPIAGPGEGNSWPDGPPSPDEDCPQHGDPERQWRHALDDLWGCIGKREIEHLQPETIRFARQNHERLWHTDDLPICFADGLPWDHPHHFATVKSPNE